MSLLEVDRLSVQYRPRDKWGRRTVFHAVCEASLAIAAGEAVGLVGESGSGKSTLGRALLGLESAADGRVLFNGQDVHALPPAARRAFCRQAQMVFQDPMGSLNPRLTVGSALAEVLQVHRIGAPAERGSRVTALLAQVGLEVEAATRYPHEFSGGQRQRIGIARALATGPSLLIADEPVSALDVSVQVQILNLLKDIQEQTGVACLFIAHDLAVVRYMCRRVLVMYRGRIVEEGPADALLSAPAHPYTAALRASVLEPGVPRPAPAAEAGSAVRPEVATDLETLTGCVFVARCPWAMAECRLAQPPLAGVGPERRRACLRAGEVLAQSEVAPQRATG